MDIAVYQKVLGDEIRRVRKSRGLTRKQLRALLPRDVSVQTLATYELGTRGCGVTRLAEICHALNELPHELLERVHKRTSRHAARTVKQITVDLRTVEKMDHPNLEPLRRWTRSKLANPSAPRVIKMEHQAIAHLAGLCDLDPVDLIGMLQE